MVGLRLQSASRFANANVDPFKNGEQHVWDVRRFVLNLQQCLKNQRWLASLSNYPNAFDFFYSERLRPITTFSELKPVDVGIWNIHLINKFIYQWSFFNCRLFMDRFI